MATVWDAIGALSGLGTLIVAVTAAWFAKNQLDNAKRVREDATRPYMMADIRQNLADIAHSDFVIENVGQTPAYDLTIDVDPPLESSVKWRFGGEIRDIYIFNNPVAMFAPGRELRVYFDDSVNRTETRPDLIRDYSVTLTYYSKPAGSQDRIKYQETLIASTNITRGVVQIEVLSMHHLAYRVGEIKDIIEGWKPKSGT